MSSSISSLWWPDDRVQSTLTPEYIISQLPPASFSRLAHPLSWGEGLTSESYLDWIFAKAGRLFLILADIGIPDRIFALVDASVDDVDLPFAAHSVDRLRLSPDGGQNPALDDRFFHAQWRFIVRGIAEGDHVKFTANEGVPVELQRTGSALAKEGVEKVILAGAVCRVYLRTQVTVGAAPHFFEEDEVLEEIRSLRRLAHGHVFSIYASYFVDKTVCILFSGHYERTLWSFLTDAPPLTFKRLPKTRRREILVNWPHCLAHGLAWLHAHGHPHRAIRPSNVLVDADYRIFLGQFEALDTLLPPLKVDDVEAYQYGAPERWLRSAMVQDAHSSQRPLLLPSGGRTARRPSTKPGKLTLPGLKISSSPPSDIHAPPDNTTTSSSSSTAAAAARPASVASQDTAIRIGAAGREGNPIITSPQIARFSFALSSCSSPSSSSSGSSDGGSTSENHTHSNRRSIISAIKQRPIFYTPSIVSSTSTTSSSSSNSSSTTTNPIIQTWHTATPHQEADIFPLAAITLDILTVLCKRKLTTFVAHRGTKNRTAGRGGGVADSSFHLDRNAGQVSSWIALLERDALKMNSNRKKTMMMKKKKKENEDADGEPRFGDVVGGMLRVIKEERMLGKEPPERPTAAQVEDWFGGVLCDAGVQVHCSEQHSGSHDTKDKYAPNDTTGKGERDNGSPCLSESVLDLDLEYTNDLCSDSD